jgi:pyridinium-3,5-bisthiocarboxylic acid mononucleotide nickel chelatase
MKIAYFDCQFGVAGDMLLGAMIDAGLDKQSWLKEVAKIALPQSSYEIAINQVQRCTIAAKKVDVLTAVDKEHVNGNIVVTEQARQMTTVASHTHSDPHGHAQEHSQHSDEVQYVHGHHHETSVPATAMTDVLKVIQASTISSSAKDLALRIVARLGRSEALVHGMSSEAIYFHEVGAVDAIVDITGFAIAYDMLGIERSYVSAVPLGSGHVQTASGLFPVPAPAVVYILAEIKAPTLPSEINYECVTPTGAAILAELCQHWGVMPTFEAVHSIGYGAGTKNPKKWPNVCRVMLGAAAAV